MTLCSTPTAFRLIQTDPPAALTWSNPGPQGAAPVAGVSCCSTNWCNGPPMSVPPPPFVPPSQAGGTQVSPACACHNIETVWQLGKGDSKCQKRNSNNIMDSYRCFEHILPLYLLPSSTDKQSLLRAPAEPPYPASLSARQGAVSGGASVSYSVALSLMLPMTLDAFNNASNQQVNPLSR